jgi:type IV fimbrial biogenesis protein FimT
MASFIPKGVVHICGFTLIELITTLAVLGITLSLAIPGMTSLIGKNAMTSRVNSVVAHLQMARSESIKRGVNTVLCPTTDGLSCHDSIDWSGGYILFSDSNQNRTPDGDDQIIAVQMPDDQRIVVMTSTGRKKLTYQPTGMSPGSNGTINFCDGQGNVPPKAVIISNTGRPRLSEKRPDGSQISCS